MKKSIFSFLFLFLLFSCGEYNPDGIYKNRQSSVLELRQLVNSKEQITQTSASFFLIAGSLDSRTETNYSVKVFAKVDGYYRVIDIPIYKLRINIDDSLQKPSLVIKYKNEKLSDSEIVNNYSVREYIINCPEKYLPEKLLPIEL